MFASELSNLALASLIVLNPIYQEIIVTGRFQTTILHKQILPAIQAPRGSTRLCQRRISTGFLHTYPSQLDPEFPPTNTKQSLHHAYKYIISFE